MESAFDWSISSETFPLRDGCSEALSSSAAPTGVTTTARWRTCWIFMRRGARISPWMRMGTVRTVEAAEGSGEGAREGRPRETYFLFFAAGRRRGAGSLSARGRDQTGTEAGGGGVRFPIMSRVRGCCSSCHLCHLSFHLWGYREHPQTKRKSKETERPRLWLR